MHIVNYGVINAPDIELNQNEVALRLKTERGFTSPEIEKCLGTLLETVRVKYSCVRSDIVFGDDGLLNLGFGEFRSKSLSQNLRGCSEVFVFAVTIGAGVDRLLQKLSLTSPSDLFITDGLSSAFVESACDEVEKRIKGDLKCKPRFSPGYGDLPLEIQPALLSMLNGQRLLGIGLNKNLMMTPTKTITAIMGIRNEN